AGDKKTLVQLPRELCPLSTFLDVLLLPPPTEGSSASSSESTAAQPAVERSTFSSAEKGWSLSSWWPRFMRPGKEKEGEDASSRHIRKRESQEKQQKDNDDLLWGVRPEVLLSAAEFR
ncbi:hypothetical protein CSUI_008905, partial [Cystoisospora suis]